MNPVTNPVTNPVKPVTACRRTPSPRARAKTTFLVTGLTGFVELPHEPRQAPAPNGAGLDEGSCCAALR